MQTEAKIPSAAEAKELHDLAAKYIWLSQRQLATPVGVPIFIKGEGCRVTDVEGKSYIDGWGGLMYKNVGYGRKEIAEAANAQMLKMSSPPMPGPVDVVVRLAAKLAEITPGSLSKNYFTTGGGEAIELSVKLARQYQRHAGFPNRYKIIARRGEYHGSSMLTMRLGFSKYFTGGYGPYAPGIVHIPIPYCYRCPYGLEYPDCGILCAKELESTIDFEGAESVAAFLMTGICQATAIMELKPKEYAPMVKSICEKYGVLLIDDEVVSGFGRTGKWFAIEHSGVTPDIMCLAKGIISGYLPLGDCITTTEIAEKFEGKKGVESFRHSITFGGLPVPCAAALANLAIFEKEKLVERAATMGAYLSKKLQPLKEHPMVGDIRGVGLMWAIELVKDRKTKQPLTGDESDALSRRLMEEGFIVATSGGVIRFLPPLVITEDELDESIAIMVKVIGEFEKKLSIR